MKQRLPKSWGFLSLTLANLAVIGSINNWALLGSYGSISLFFFLLAGLLFFLPSVFVTAELASTWHQTGGIYVWVKEAFGHRAAFTAVWIMWIQQIFWYPVPLLIIATSSASLFYPSLTLNRRFQLLAVAALIVLMTVAFLRGLRLLRWINFFGVMLGMILPAGIIMTFGFFWIWNKEPLALTFSLKSFTKDITNIKNWSTFASILTTFAGIEISTYHALGVKEPKKNYPKAAFLTAPISFALYLFGTLALISVVEQKKINLFQNDADILELFFKTLNVPALFPFMLVLILLGMFTEMNGWYTGPIKGLLAVAKHGDLPPCFRRINAQGMPTLLIFVQAFFGFAFSLLFIFLPQAEALSWIAVALIIMLYFIAYFFIFAAAIKLRYSKPDVPRPYQIPGGMPGIWLVAGLGLATSVIVFVLAFLLPQYMLNLSSLHYTPWFSLVLILICLTPNFILCFKQKSWSQLPEKDIEP